MYFSHTCLQNVTFYNFLAFKYFGLKFSPFVQIIDRSKYKLVCENTMTQAHGSYSLRIMGSCANLNFVAPKTIHTPHGGHFCFRPYPTGISIPGGTCHTPKAWNFYNFPTWLVAPCKEYFFNNAAALYFRAKDKLVSTIKREKSFYLC